MSIESFDIFDAAAAVALNIFLPYREMAQMCHGDCAGGRQAGLRHLLRHAKAEKKKDF